MRRIQTRPPAGISQKAISRAFSHIGVMRRLYDLIRAEGSQAAAARKIGVTRTFLGKVLRGEKAPGEKIADFFGLERHVIYVRKPKWERKTSYTQEEAEERGYPAEDIQVAIEDHEA